MSEQKPDDALYEALQELECASDDNPVCWYNTVDAFVQLAALRAAASEADALRAELDKWRTWKPYDEDLKSLAQQAMKRDGSHSESLAACWAYIRGLEAWLREHDALRATVAEQARKIETARKLILGYKGPAVDGCKCAWCAWLAANAPTPAPEADQEEVAL